MTTITQQRQKWAAVAGAPSIRRREQWGARFGSYGNFTGRAASTPGKQVFIHITVTNFRNYASNDAHARAIESIGISRFPNTGISYNFGVMPDGSLYEFQPVGRRGAHTVNDHQRRTCNRWGTACPGNGQDLTATSSNLWNLNITARSIVICQNVNDPVSDKQVDTIARTIVTCFVAGFITWHAAHHPHGHRCVSSKDCPARYMWALMGKLHDLIHHYRDKGLGGGTTPAPTPTPAPPPSTGGTVSWDQTLAATDMARQRIPDSYSLRAEHALTHTLGLAYQATHDKVALNTSTRNGFPDQPAEGYAPRVLWRANYGHLLFLRRDVDKLLDEVRAVRAAQGDGQRDQVLAEIQADLQQARDERQAIADHLDVLSALQGQLLGLVEEALSGERDAAEVLRALAGILNAAVAEPAGDESTGEQP